jgi:hypothetical protein
MNGAALIKDMLGSMALNWANDKDRIVFLEQQLEATTKERDALKAAADKAKEPEPDAA